MAHAHGHSHAQSLDLRRADSRRRMRLALAINAAMLVAELVGGLLIGSLALVADAGHVLSDVGAIGLALVASALAAARPSSPGWTFGLQRSEIVAALINGLVLAGIAVAILVVAIGRFGDPPEIEGAGVLALGGVGFAGNLAATLVLYRGRREDINLEAVLRHSAADALGSLGVIVSGALILIAGWAIVDPVVAVLIAALVLASSWRLIREPFGVLMERAPAGVDVEELGSAMCTVEGVREVHDLHVWTVTAGFPAVTAHVAVDPEADRDLVRNGIEALLRERYAIEHTTLQMVVEPPPGLLDVETGPATPPADEPGSSAR